MTDPYNPDPNSSYPPPMAEGRVSGMAITAMVLGLIGAVGCFPVGIVGLVLGILALSKINSRPQEFGGKGFAITGIVGGILSLTIMPIALLIAILLPSLGKARELANRAQCAANITGTLKACVVYAQDQGDSFPMTSYNKPGYNVYFGTADSGSNSFGGAMNGIQTSPNAQGNPASCLWILCVQGSTSTKSLQCKSDPYADAAASPLQNSSNMYYVAPTSQGHLSYSIASPWMATPGGMSGAEAAGGATTLSGVWRNHTNATIPMMSDMAPVNGTGGRSFTMANSSRPKALNSNNHSVGEGQEVGFGDCHVEWSRTPAVGPNGDFIFTINPTAGGTWSGMQATGSMPITPSDPLLDVQMIPARNLDDHSVR